MAEGDETVRKRLSEQLTAGPRCHRTWAGEGIMVPYGCTVLCTKGEVKQSVAVRWQ